MSFDRLISKIGLQQSRYFRWFGQTWERLRLNRLQYAAKVGAGVSVCSPCGGGISHDLLSQSALQSPGHLSLLGAFLFFRPKRPPKVIGFQFAALDGIDQNNNKNHVSAYSALTTLGVFDCIGFLTGGERGIRTPVPVAR